MRNKLILLVMVLFVGLFLAGCGGSVLKDIDDTIDSVVATVEVSGVETIKIPEAGSVTAQYTAKVKDQYGSEMSDEEINWSVANVAGSDVNANVYIDTNGVVTVSNMSTTKVDSFKVLATSDTNTDFKGELLVSLEDVQSGTVIDLGTAGNYVILSHAGITNVPSSTITGDIGVSPIDATAITGFSLTVDSSNEFATSAQITGKAYAADYASPTPVNLTTAVSNMGTAYTDAAGRANDYTELYAGDLSGKTLNPGVYKWSSDVLINAGGVTLNGTAEQIWIFQISGKLTQAGNTNIILAGGAQAKNIFWQVADTVSIGTGAHFEGIVLGWKNITLGTGAAVNGRLFALNENVTLDKNTIIEPQ